LQAGKASWREEKKDARWNRAEVTSSATIGWLDDFLVVKSASQKLYRIPIAGNESAENSEESLSHPAMASGPGTACEPTAADSVPFSGEVAVDGPAIVVKPIFHEPRGAPILRNNPFMVFVVRYKSGWK